LRNFFLDESLDVFLSKVVDDFVDGRGWSFTSSELDANVDGRGFSSSRASAFSCSVGKFGTHDVGYGVSASVSQASQRLAGSSYESVSSLITRDYGGSAQASSGKSETSGASHAS